MRSDPLDLEVVVAHIHAALTEVRRLCEEAPRAQFRMSVPAREGYDSDLILVAALRDATALIAELRAAKVDVARLDWLESLLTSETPRVELDHHRVGPDKQPGRFVNLARFVDYDRTTDGTEGFGNSLRAAIDDARSASGAPA